MTSTGSDTPAAVLRASLIVRPARRIAGYADRHRFKTILILSLGALLYSQCLRPLPWVSPDPLPSPSSTARSLTVGPNAWAAPGGDWGVTRVTDAEPPLDGEIAWRVQLEPPVTTPFVTDGRALYIAFPEAQRVAAISTEDGTELWSVDTAGQSDHAPAVAGGIVYVQVRRGGLLALLASTGATLWIDPSDRALTATPTIADGVLWAGMRGRLAALDAETGELLGETSIGSRFVRLRPAVGAEHVVVAKTDTLLIFDRTTAERTFQARFPDLKHVAVAGGTVIGVSPRQLVAFDPDEGLPWWDGTRDWWFRLHLFMGLPDVPAPPSRWVQQTRCEPHGPVLQPAQVVLACADGSVRAFDLQTGALRWERHGAPIVASPVLTASGLLIAERAALVLLDPGSGAELQRRSLGDDISVREVIVTASAIYILTTSDELIALR